MKTFSFFLAAAVISLAHSTGRAEDRKTTGAVTKVPVTFSEGHETDSRDHGRPVVLVAAGLGVAPEVFREAFSHVHPAGPDRGGPTDSEARANKAALMSALGKYGITNDRLDEVSNYYRYMGARGQMWKNRPAVANALVQNGVVTGFEIVDAGAGYSSAPKVNVPNIPGASAKVDLSFGKDLTTNGSISAITVSRDKAK
jgi:hypothetical protein